MKGNMMIGNMMIGNMMIGNMMIGNMIAGKTIRPFAPMIDLNLSGSAAILWRPILSRRHDSHQIAFNEGGSGISSQMLNDLELQGRLGH